MSNDVSVSTVAQAPTIEAIYSLLSAYGDRRGTDLPGTWFVAALEPLGHQPAAVRQALRRHVASGDLVVQKRGRTNYYALGELLRGFTATGREKIFGPIDPPWDRHWTLANYQFGIERSERDRVREILEIEGFGQLGRGVFLHPRDRVDRVRDGLRAAGLVDRVGVFRASWQHDEPERQLAARIWPLADLARLYARFARQFAPMAKRAVNPERAFARRLALALAYLEIAWDDPDLPSELLPRDWPGHRARKLTADLYEQLLPGTLAHGDALLQQVDSSLPT